jgi:hypothetical protein
MARHLVLENRHLGVDGHCFQPGMAQELLNETNIGAILQ